MGISRLAVCVGIVATLPACASTSPQGGFDDVARVTAERTAHELHWNRASLEDASVDRAVRQMLAGEMAVDQAVQIALLNNRNLIAIYEELSISQADLVQAGLLKNPVFTLGVTAAEGDRLDPNLLGSVTSDFLDVFLLPARKKIAAARLEATKQRVAAAVLDLATDVEAAYYTLQASSQVAAMRRVVADAARASLEMATHQHEAGNASDLSLANEQGAYEGFAVDLSRSEADVLAARERLTRLLGLWGADTAFRLPQRLPDLPKLDLPVENLEALAISQRLDLGAMRSEREAFGVALSLAKSTRYVPGVGVGAEAGRLTSGRLSVGPSASLELPIFDQKQAAVARLEALLRASDDRIHARAVEVRSEVRQARDRVVIARSLVAHYRDVVIPGREQIVALSQEQYGAMLLGVYQLLAAKQSEASAYREYIEMVRDYWLARVDLERAVGGRLLPSEQNKRPGATMSGAAR